MKILGKELTFNGNKVYHAGNKPTASEIGAAASSHTHNYAGSSSAGGNANAAVKLATARTINGTSFDGSANITTANWGTARNIQIGNTSKSVNGSANVSWSLSEIGAAAASHGRHIPDVCETITDWNNATKNGWYMGNNATNSPTANAWYFGEVIAHNANYVVQTVYQFTASTDAKAIPKYIRAKMNGTWGAWTNVTVAKAVPSNAVFTDTNTWRGVQDNLTSTATDQSLSANQGKVLKGLIDGKAASNHTHSYLPLSGGTMTGAISSSLNTGTYLEGNKGRALVNSTNAAGGYTALVKSNSTNGYFTQATYQGNHLLQYTAKSTVDAGNNSVTKTATLLNESGNSSFPGTVSAPTFSGALSGNATTASSLASARLIGKASFNGSANIALDAIAGRATIPSSADTHKNKYSKFARIDVSGGTYRCCSGTLHFVPSEGNTFFGELRYYFRTGSAISSISIDLRWKNLSNTSYANRVFAVKVSDGVYDLYYQPLVDWDTMTVTNVNSVGASYITLTSNQAYVTSITAAVTSSLSSHVSNATTANTATTLATARTINGTSFNGSGNITTANWGTARNIQIGNTTKSVNGSGNVSWSLSEIGAAASNHTHGLVNLNSEAFSGGNDLNTYNSTKTWVARTFNSTTNRPDDWYTVANFGADGNSNFQLAHSYANNSILYVRGRHDKSGNYTPWAKIYTDKNKPTASEIGAAASSHTHNYAGSSSAGGAANSATKLATARSINGTNFDGTGNITTANWGTARNLQIGNTAKSVNGSANVTWTLSEIGAAAASHTHNYAATSHNHGLLHDSFGVTIADTTTDNGWSMINGSYNGFLLKSIRSSASAPAWLQGNYSAGIAFGGADTKGVMSVAYNSPSVRFAGGNGSKPVWHFTVNGSSGKTYNMDSIAANTANTLATARTINGTSFNGSANITTANWGTARNITIGNTTKSVNGSANVSWTAAEIGVASINDSTTATGTVWSSNKTQVQINTSYNTMSQKVDALEESINRDFVSKNGSTMTGDLTIKKSNGAAAKLNVHRTINSNDMQGTIDIYAHNGGSVALSTNNKTSGKQTSSYVFGGDAFWSPRNADGTVPSIGLSNYRFEKAWLNKLDAKDAIFTSGNLTVQGQTTLGPTILNNNTSLYGYNTSGTQINICGVDNSNNIYLGWNNQTYINVNNTMRVYRDLHILNGNALRVTGQTVLARTDSTRQIAVVSTAGDGNGKGDGQTHLGYYDSGYHHYFRGSGAMHVDMLGGLKIEGKRLSIGSAAHSNPATGDVWIQI